MSTNPHFDPEKIDKTVPNKKKGKKKPFEVPALIKDGDRHATIFAMFRSLKARQFPFDAAVAACASVNKTNCETPLTDDKLEFQRWWDEDDTFSPRQATPIDPDEFSSYFITQLGAKDGGRLITMVGCDATFPPSFQTFAAFRDYHADTLINIGTVDAPKWTTRAKLWITNASHRKYIGIEFIPPPLPVPPGILNLWNGFAVTPDPDPYPERRCALFLAHVREVVCAGEDAHVADFLLDVLAAKVQRPAKLTEVSIVMRGDEGVGKGTLTDYYSRLFGRHAAIVDKQELVTGRFNAVLSAKLVLTLDEAMWPGHREFNGALKSLITNIYLQIERKGIDPVDEPNYVQTFVLTNRDWAWPTSLGDRRGLILNVSLAKKGDLAYWDDLYRERDHGGVSALLAYLQQRPIGHDLRKVPHTKARETQVALTDDDPVRSMWFDMLQRGTIWPERTAWEDFISRKDFEEAYTAQCRAQRHKPLPPKLLLQRFRDLLPEATEEKQRRIVDRDVLLHDRLYPHRDGVRLETVQRRGWVVPGIDTCRDHYATSIDQPAMEWPATEVEDVEPVPF